MMLVDQETKKIVYVCSNMCEIQNFTFRELTFMLFLKLHPQNKVQDVSFNLKKNEKKNAEFIIAGIYHRTGNFNDFDL